MKSTAIRHILDTATLILRIGIGNISTLATFSAALPYGNATSTVKNRNDASPPSGTSLHFHLILELQLTTPTASPSP